MLEVVEEELVIMEEPPEQQHTVEEPVVLQVVPIAATTVLRELSIEAVVEVVLDISLPAVRVVLV